MRATTSRIILSIAKLALGLLILIVLLIQAREGFLRILEQTIHWPLLGAALACTFGAATLSFIRWHLLIRALGINIRLFDTLRLGALGLALNFVSPGAIGGDFFKAIFLAHGQPGRRTEAIFTVIVDRLVGLLTMLAIGSIGILATNLLHASSAPLRILCRLILLVAAAGWLGVALLLTLPAFTGPRVSNWFEQVPIVGRTCVRLLAAARAYRNQIPILITAFGLSAMGALMYVSSYYLVARGLPIEKPTWAEHLVIIPVAGLVGAIPITPSGLGTLELAVKELYKYVLGGIAVGADDGTLVALVRRVTELAVAFVGVLFYLTHRREVEQVYAEASLDMET